MYFIPHNIVASVLVFEIQREDEGWLPTQPPSEVANHRFSIIGVSMTNKQPGWFPDPGERARLAGSGSDQPHAHSESDPR